MNNKKIQDIRQEFPILHQTVNDEPLIYFDNAATSQTPEAVIQAVVDFYHHDKANAHRGVHTLGQRATEAFEKGRSKTAEFIGAASDSEVSFTSGTTGGINQLARGLVEPGLEAGDLILTTRLEHHSNLIPWQELCHRTGAELAFMPLNAENFIVDLEELDHQFKNRPVKAVVVQHISNILGTEQPIQALTEWAHQRDSLIIVDGAQAAPHVKLNLAQWGVDGYAFSSHKMYGPMGLGVNYIAKRHHQKARPVIFGGEMIHLVEDVQSTYKNAPWKFEAGTQPIAQITGLTRAIEWMETIGMDFIAQQEAVLGRALYTGLEQIEGITLYTPELAAENGIISFNFDGIHPHDAATAYDQLGIALRAGHHCGQPLMRLLGTHATLRASVMVYNTQDEVKRFLGATQEVKEFFNYGS